MELKCLKQRTKENKASGSYSTLLATIHSGQFFGFNPTLETNTLMVTIDTKLVVGPRTGLATW